MSSSHEIKSQEEPTLDSEQMGAGLSKSPARGIVLTLDALRTLYRFRAPLAVQYAEIARKCGLNQELDPVKLTESFHKAFKYYGTQHPNYGKGTLANPEVWWTGLVNQAFGELVNKQDIPPDLGSSLYHHFSSGAAYELYPDVKPFLESMHQLRTQYHDADGPIIVLGIVTNSDPRVRQVLDSLSLQVGPSQQPKFNLAEEMRKTREAEEELHNTGKITVKSLWHDYWNPRNDFDFLATSYEAGYEKPDHRIFSYARGFSGFMRMSRAEQQVEASTSQGKATMKVLTSSTSQILGSQDFTYIHVGDEYVKDYQAAEQAGFEALHIVREGEGDEKPGVKTVSSLYEVASIINVMAEENFNDRKEE